MPWSAGAQRGVQQGADQDPLPRGTEAGRLTAVMVAIGGTKEAAIGGKNLGFSYGLVGEIMVKRGENWITNGLNHVKSEFYPFSGVIMVNNGW